MSDGQNHISEDWYLVSYRTSRKTSNSILRGCIINFKRILAGVCKGVSTKTIRSPVYRRWSKICKWKNCISRSQIPRHLLHIKFIYFRSRLVYIPCDFILTTFIWNFQMQTLQTVILEANLNLMISLGMYQPVDTLIRDYPYIVIHVNVRNDEIFMVLRQFHWWI